MSNATLAERKCVFIDRPCRVDLDEIPLEVCRLCIEAWKHISERLDVKRTPTPAHLETQKPIKDKLRELDKLFEDDKIDLKDYVERRRMLLASTSAEGSWLETIEETFLEAPKSPGIIIVRGGKIELTYPDDWKPPKNLTEAAKTLYELCKALGEESQNLRVKAGKIGVISLGLRDDRFILLFTPSSMLERYENTVRQIAFTLARAKDIAKELPKIYDEIFLEGQKTSAVQQTLSQREE
ncbi:MAG: hypothetical protein N3E47_02690 [Candidatus Bathyarchaeota archaeon]|nr:hypothetical protein [Candidatus Bathyarchaeota archaeon]